MLAYSGRGKFVVEPVNLSHVVHEMTQLLGRVISKRARLSLHLRDDVPPDRRRRHAAAAGGDEPDHQRVRRARWASPGW